jgi:biopolymer transport protein ExbB
MTLLQIVTSDTLNAVSEQESVSVLELLMKGGWTMIPILILSIIAVYIFVERLMTLKKAAQLPKEFMDKIKRMVLEGDVNGAKSMCATSNSPTARMIEKGITRLGSPLKNIEASIENVGRIEIYKLEKNLNVLATISGAAPMLGFFGTVLGMIQAFMAIAQEEGSVSPKLLSSGIYEAMITTATGLFVGIIAYIGYNYLIARVQKVIHRMEYNSVEFIDLLQEPNN